MTTDGLLSRVRRTARFEPGTLLLIALSSSCQGDTIRLGDGRDSALPELAAPTVIESVSRPGATDDDPSLNGDLTLLYFNSKRDGGKGKEDIWQSLRSDAQSDWQPPVPVAELNSEQRETGIALSTDGLLILFSSDRPSGAGGLDIYLARRAATTATFDAPQRVSTLCSAGDDLVSALSADGELVYLARRSSEDEDYALLSARRSTAGSFEAPQPLATLDAEGPESDAFPVASDGLLFTRDQQLMFARRSSGRAPFVTVGPLVSLNSSADDRDAWSTQDLSYVVFSSDRSGSYQLYEARRVSPPRE